MNMEMYKYIFGFNSQCKVKEVVRLKKPGSDNQKKISTLSIEL